MHKHCTALNVKLKCLSKRKKAACIALIADCLISMEVDSITVICPHEITKIRVLESIATCETTVLVCMECGLELETPKTEC
jgi:hypothetical protein